MAQTRPGRTTTDSTPVLRLSAAAQTTDDEHLHIAGAGHHLNCRLLAGLINWLFGARIDDLLSAYWVFRFPLER